MQHRIDLTQIAAFADLIRDMTEGDETAFVDTLDGETDAVDVLRQLVKARVEAKAYEAACKEAAKEYTDRARRMADRQNAITRAMGEILDATGQQKLAFDLATISRTKARLSLTVYDEAQIPTQLRKSVPDTAAIRAQLDAGEDVPGARLDLGEPGLTVRVK